jgi:pyroglutamyl-peptidase
VVSVLITGFGRFPGTPFNPSGPLALALARRRRPAFAEVRRAVHIFETSYAAVDRDLPKLIARHKPDILLMFGLAARTPFLRVEMRARNAMSILFPDVSGYRPDRRAIAPGKPDARGRAPFARLLGAARASGTRSRLSRDAGRYLCNYVYFRALEASRSGTPLAQFIHIPPVARGPRRPARKRRVSHAALVRTGEAVLLALIAARRG